MGFSKSFVDSKFNKVKEISRDSLLCQEERKGKKRNMTPLVLIFHPALLGIGKFVDY